MAINSRDMDGHYCGQRVSDGEMEPSPPDKMGYCGPECAHCVSWPVYVAQDGVYCCAADFDFDTR